MHTRHSVTKGRFGVRKIRSLLTLGAVVCALGVAHVSAAPIRGTLDAKSPPPSSNKKGASYWQEWNGVVPPRPIRADLDRRVTVILTGPGTPEKVTWKLLGGAPSPETLVVAPGQEITIENTDIFDHQLFAEGLPGFESLQTASGNSRTVKVASPGTWKVRDALHGDLEAFVVAVPNVAAVATVDSSGRFSFPSMDPGQYVVHVFYRGKELAQKLVTVTGTREVNLGGLSISFPAEAM